MKTIVIIQARMGSSRLPGKMLMELGGKTVISHVIERCNLIPEVNHVCVALPRDKSNDILHDRIKNESCSVYRGDETDVLTRYVDAARSMKADNIIRITADKPLIDPQICGQVLNLLLSNKADFSCNNMPASWPHGLDCEAFTSDILFLADKSAADKSDREHVTPWMRRSSKVHCLNLPGPGREVVNLRWTLDYQEDLDFLREVFKRMAKKKEIPLYEDVMELLKSNPELLKINDCWSHLSRYAEDKSQLL
jgi:spore coat polysaccharide biosynthesis protein SpsF (cytidylyltransferase family)|tara:strand:+ start:666 stop:1418 length:753 start_codon:yes stop_codon:yes gene_type:complete